MIEIEHKVTKERQNVASMDRYSAAEWQQVGSLPAGAAGDLSMFGAGAAAAVEDLAKVKSTLIAQIKTANAAMVSGLYTTNFGKQKKYSRKQQEVLDFRSLASSLLPLNTVLTQSLSTLLPVFGQLNATAQRKKFRFAMAEAAKRGTTVDVVVAEWEQTIDTIEDQIAAWEAVEQDAVRRIKAATAVSAARAIAAALDWAWRP